MFQFLCGCSLGYYQLCEKIELGGYVAVLVFKGIRKSVHWEQQFSVNISGIFERSYELTPSLCLKWNIWNKAYNIQLYVAWYSYCNK